MIQDKYNDFYSENLKAPSFKMNLSKDSLIQEYEFAFDLDERNNELYIHTDEADLILDIDERYTLIEHFTKLYEILLEELKQNGYKVVRSSFEELILDLKTTHLFIQLTVQDGMREHTHNIVTSTLCENIEFAVGWYASHYWGVGTLERHDRQFFWWFDDEITVRISSYKVITPDEANFLNELL